MSDLYRDQPWIMRWNSGRMQWDVFADDTEDRPGPAADTAVADQPRVDSASGQPGRDSAGAFTGDPADIQMQVISDMFKRRAEGYETYGRPLLPHNGRNALQDLYEELLDACMYVKQALLESADGRG